MANYSNTTLIFGHYYVYSGESANNTEVGVLCGLTISSGGVANNIAVSSGGNLIVFSGGVANSTTVKHEGNLDVSSGGTANCTTVNYFGNLTVFSGGTANSTTVNSGGGFQIFSGGTANSTTVNSGGRLDVDFGDVVNSTTVNSGGNLYVSSGGTATGVTVNNDGNLIVTSEGTATIAFNPWQGNIVSSNDATIMYLNRDAKVYYGGSATGLVSKADVIDSLYAESGYSALIYSGGTVNSTTVKFGGNLTVFSGGVANNIAVSSGGNLTVSSGGSATIFFNPWQGNIVSSNGATINYLERDANIYYGNRGNLIGKYDIFDFQTINAGYSAIVYHDGVANDITVNSGGNLTISSGGVANNTTLNIQGTLTVYDGGVANETTFNSGGNLTVYSGGVANSTTLNNWGRLLNISSGGVANCTTVNYYHFQVSSGVVANSTTLNKGGTLTVYDGGVANNTTINSSGNLAVSSGGVANCTTVNDGNLTVSSGGVANCTTVNDGNLTVSSGGTATIAFNPWQKGSIVSSNDATIMYLDRDAKVYYGGSAAGLVSKADVMDSLSLASGHSAIVYSGGVANNTTINFSGNLTVFSGGVANSTMVNGGNLHVSIGGTANGVTANGISVYGSSYICVSSGGTANDVTVNSYGYLHVSSGGVANSTMVNSGGNLYVSNGGSATIVFNPWQGNIVSSNGATINYLERDAFFYFGSNGALISKTDNIDSQSVESGYSAIVYSGGTANSTTVNSRGYLYVSSGGIANSTMVNGGNLTVSSGGIANSTTVNGGGNLTVSSGGVAREIVENGGYVFVEDGADVTFVANTLTGLVFSYYYTSATVHSGTTANNTTVNGGNLTVFSGGVANSTTVNGGGNLTVSSGGIANNTTVNGGNLTVSSGGIANDITVNSRGNLTISSGGVAREIVENGGYVFVEDGADVTFVANTLTGLVLSYTSATVHSGTTANSTTVNWSGNLTVFSGGVANSTTVNAEGYFKMNGGIAYNTTVGGSRGRWFGFFTVSGGTANSTTVNGGGNLTVFSGGVANSTTVNGGGNLTVSSGGIANSTMVNGGNLTVFSGGVANSTTVNGGGNLTVSSGGIMNSTMVNGGNLTVSSGGTATYVDWTPFAGMVSVEEGAYVTYSDKSGVYYGSGYQLWSHEQEIESQTVTNASMYVMSDGTADNATVDNGGLLAIWNGGVGNSATVNSGGSMDVSSGGIVKGTTVNSFGLLFVQDGGNVDGATVNAWGRVTVSSGGTAANISVSKNGDLTVFGGGAATGIEAASGAHLELGVAASTHIQGTYGGSAFEIRNATASGFSVNRNIELMVSSGGTAASITAEKEGILTISSGGKGVGIVENGGYVTVEDGADVMFASHTISGLLLELDSATIHSGTTAAGGTIRGSGFLDVFSGGIASGVTVDREGVLTVSSGGLASGGKVNTRGVLAVLSGGTADGATVNSSGTLTVNAGGSANKITVNSVGSATVSSGGMATEVNVNDGTFTVLDGGTATILFNPWMGTIHADEEEADVTYLERDAGVYYGNGNTGLISRADVMDPLDLEYNFSALVYSGGTAGNVLVNSGGRLIVSSGGSATVVFNPWQGRIDADEDVTVTYLERDAKVYYGGVDVGLVSRADVMNSLGIEGGHSALVYSGGSVNAATVKISGSLILSSGGMASRITMEERAQLHVSAGGTASRISNADGSMYVSEGGVVNSADIYGALGKLNVLSGGTANGIFVHEGIAAVSEGGMMNRATVDSAGDLDVSSGGTVNSATVDAGGSFTVLRGGVANDIAVNGSSFPGDTEYGKFIVSSGGTASGVTVNKGGYFFVSGGGSAVQVVENGGQVSIQAGANVSFASHTLNGLMLRDAETMTVHSGTTANSTFVGRDADLVVFSGGVANDTFIDGAGSTGGMEIRSGGTASSVVNLGSMSIESGGILTGKVRLTTDASINVYQGGIVNFDISGVTPDDPARISDLSRITGSPTYTLTFDEDQEEGIYTLAKGAAAFNQTITVTYGEDAFDYEVLVLGERTTINGLVLKLTVESDALVLRVGPFPSDPSENILNNSVPAAEETLNIQDGLISNDADINSGAVLLVSGNGIANGAMVNLEGQMCIRSGGTANSTFINSSGWGYVSSGGVANSTMIHGGFMYVSNGGKASDTMVFDDGVFYVRSGGTANSTTVNQNGALTVMNGGTANGITVFSGGVLNVSSGGSAVNYVAERGASLNFAVVPDTYVKGTSDGNPFEMNNGIVTGYTINGGGLVVSSGGVASNVTVNGEIVENEEDGDEPAAGTLTVSKGGMVSDIMVNGNGNLVVCSSGAANGVNVGGGWNDGWVVVSNGGAVNDIMVSSGGRFLVQSGGTATGVTVNSGGKLDVESGGTATIAFHPWQERLAVSKGAVVTYLGAEDRDANVFYGDEGILISKADVMNSLCIESGYRAIVYSGGIVNDTVVSSIIDETGEYCRGSLIVSGGGVANNTVISGIYREGYDEENETEYAVRCFGSLIVESGGIANGVTVSYGETGGETKVPCGTLVVSSGGTAVNINIAQRCHFELAVTPDTYIQGTYCGSAFEMKDGVISGLILEQSELEVFSGGVADSITLIGDMDYYATINVYDGGTANNTIINEDGRVYVYSGGTANNITVNSDGGLVVERGGKLTGRLTVQGNWRNVSISNGAIIDFDLTQTTAGDDALVDDISRILDAPVYTLTVTGMHRSGTYRLAGGATGFNRTISIISTTGDVLGTLSVGQTLAFEHNEYKLVLDESTLILSVTGDVRDSIPPTVSNVAADTTDLTNHDVTVSAVFADDEELAQSLYRIGETGEWLAYRNGVAITENATVYFKAVDAAGNESEIVSYTVSNIDKVKPTVSGIAPNTTDPVKSVTVTANFADNVAVASMLYRIGDGAWTAYGKDGVTVTENCTVYFKAIDTVGNESEEAIYTVTNILTPDTVAPTVVNAAADIMALTNLDVTVTADFTDNVTVAKKQYRIGNGAWTDYTTGVIATENCTVYFKAVDAAGNESEIVSYEVTNIDKTKPLVSNVMPSTTALTNRNVTVSADFSDNIAVASSLYKIGSGEWTAYGKDGVVVSENTTVYFKAVDTAGNESVEASYVIENIDKVKPTVSAITPSTTGLTNQDVTVTAAFADDVSLASSFYRIGDNGEWMVYPVGTAGVAVSENTTVYFKAVDTAGNESAEASCVIDNIDKIAPDKPTAAADVTDPTTDSVEVSAVFSEDSVKREYSLDNGNAWQDYTAAVEFKTNGTVLFRGTDAAGNVSEAAKYSVTNIETSTPDTSAPTVSNVMADITTPTNQNVTVTAVFSDDVAVASALYRIGSSGAWTEYSGGVTITDNTIVYFKAIDLSGNESEVVSYEVSNICKVPPVKPTVSADITAATNQNVTVTAVFSDNSEKKEYSLDGGNTWQDYTGSLELSENGTVYFRGIDAVGNISEIASYEVANIDKVPPAKPTASADITAPTSGRVIVTAVFSGDSVKKEFSLDGLAWQDYSTPLVFSVNGKAYFRGTDAAGNVSDIISYDVTNIQPVTPDNAPDDNRNDWGYNKKTKEWNSAENLASFVVNEVKAGDSMVYLDKKDSIESEDGKYFNSVGRTGTVEDTADYAKIELAYGAALKFSIDSTIGGTFYVYEATQDKKGDLVATQRQKITVKAGKTSPAKLSTIYLEAGEYFVGMEAKLPAAKKNPEVGAYYNVQLTGTKYYEDADDGWNDHAYALDANGKEDKTKLNAALVSGAYDFGRGATAIKPDTGKNWVGFSDATDYKMIRLENAMNLTLNFTATGKAKLAIWKVSTGNGGKITLSSKGTVTVKADKTGTIKAKFLDAGEYFVSVTSTDAKKGGDAYYSIAVDNEKTVFFDSNDDGKNNVLYDKKAKSFYMEDANHHFETTTVGTGTHVKLDSDPVADPGWENFVGYQDAVDYAKIKLTGNGNLSFHIEATGDATFTVYRKGEDKKGNDTLEAIQSAKLAVASGASKTAKDMQISGLTAGEYYVSMAAKSTKATDKGSVFYNVTATLDTSVSSALEMPMALTAYADSVQDKLFGETGNGLLASL